MRKCCFLSMDSLEGYVSDDDLAIEPLRRMGWEVTTLSWRAGETDWNEFEAVVIRTPWDYQNDPDAFLSVLRRIDASSARLENPLRIVEWNLNKLYLRELEEKGIPIVPTFWGSDTLTQEVFESYKKRLDTEELIIKPTVSATAQDTYRTSRYMPDLASIFNGRGFLIQPFIDSIINEGEYSLFYFNGNYSHTILKAPKAGDFRVQEEHGGIIAAVQPDPKLRAEADNVNAAISPLPLYSRVDLVRDGEGGFLLMELELIEPALYFRMDEQAPENFARAFDDRMNEL